MQSGTLLGDVPTANVDRLLQHSDVLEMMRKIYRLNGQKRDRPAASQADKNTRADKLNPWN